MSAARLLATSLHLLLPGNAILVDNQGGVLEVYLKRNWFTDLGVPRYAVYAVSTLSAHCPNPLLSFPLLEVVCVRGLFAIIGNPSDPAMRPEKSSWG